MAKVLGLKQLLQKKYFFLPNLPENITESFGQLVDNFIMIVWGMSGNGKSNFILQFLRAIMPHGKVLYLALEEGFEATTQMNAIRQLNEKDHNGRIEFADHEMTYDELIKKLRKKKSPKFIVIDSIQYWDITFDDYKKMKEMFPKKSFIFISHASGKIPDGKVADKIRYDSGIKVRVDGFIAFVLSRYGGTKPYVIQEDRAKAFHGKKYKQLLRSVGTYEALDVKTKTKPPRKKKHENTSLSTDKPLEGPEELVLGERQVQREIEGVFPELASQSIIR